MHEVGRAAEERRRRGAHDVGGIAEVDGSALGEDFCLAVVGVEVAAEVRVGEDMGGLVEAGADEGEVGAAVDGGPLRDGRSWKV